MTQPLLRRLACGAVGVMVGVLPALRAQEVIRTADITVRGLKNGDFPRLTKLAERVYAYEQIDPTKKVVTVNNLIVITSEGVVVADGQGTVENAQRLVADIRTLTPLPIRYVIVCSEHGDHTGGNTGFPDSTVFIASPASKANLERQAAAASQRPNAPKTVVPTETASGTRVLSMGDTEIRILSLGRAHTGGDLEVYLPKERILWMSEVFSNRIFPSMANSSPSEWIETLKNAERMDVSLYVPAHGFVDSAAILKEEERNFRAALERVMAEGKRLHDARVPADQAIGRADFGSFGDWTRRAENAAAALKRVYMELDGEIK